MNHIDVKKEAWSRQEQTLQSPLYRLTLVARSEDGKTFNLGKKKSEQQERFWTTEEVAEKISFLSAKNAQGWDIYVTPISDSYHYIVVDDMTAEGLQELKTVGYSPCLIQTSSQGNIQSILKVEKVPGNKEQSRANDLVMQLNREWGDPAFSGVVHPFRMAGFANRKPGRNNFFTRVLEISGEICMKASAELAELRKERPIKKKKNVSRGNIPGTGNIQDELRQAEKDARKMIVGLVRSKGWEQNDSAIDYRVAKELFCQGFSWDDVYTAILSFSPALSGRHSDPADYVSRTLEKANV